MDFGFVVINGALGMLGSFLVLRRFRHVGLCLAGLSLLAGSGIAFYDEQWWPSLAGALLALLCAKLIGNPLEP
jgi:ABC-type Mn2+/Zn2+ transport system permease subunit